MTEGTHLDEDMASNFWLKFFFVMFIMIMAIGAFVGGNAAYKAICPEAAHEEAPAPSGH
jgi:hypothetical protein